MRLTATDLNPPMLEIARAKFRPGDQVEFQLADATALPFADGSFDAIVCQFGVMFFPDKDKSYREVFRVLAPAGHYMFNVWDWHRHNPAGRIAHEVIGSFFQKIRLSFRACRTPIDSSRSKISLIDVGFTNINAAIVQLQKEVPDLAILARGLVYGSPIIDQVRQRGSVEAERIVDAIVRQYRNEFGSDPARVPLQAIVFSAQKPS